MKPTICLLLLSAASISAWLPASTTGRSLTSLQLSTAPTTPNVYEKPERVIMDEVPTLYVYDHCPFCVRVRVALGVKNIKHNLYFLANDDIATPTKLVGKKISPIFVSDLAYYCRCLNHITHFAILLLPIGIPCGWHCYARVYGHHQFG
jgi:hypothetical protein